LFSGGARDFRPTVKLLLHGSASAKPEGSGALVWSCCSGWKKIDGSDVNL
jgi:hypothetical protein